LKELASQNKIVPRIVFVGGISRPGDKLHLMQIKFIIQVAAVLERDEDTRQYLRLIFLPNYSTSKEYLYVPALDVNEQLTIPGKQSCTTQPLKFVMNGSILIGSKDSTNLRIENTLGENIVLLFGLDYYE
jgi:starch phosphorylase